MRDLVGQIESGRVRLEPFVDDHVEPLRLACAEDTQIWEIYPFSMQGEHFDCAMQAFHGTQNWVRFAVIDLQEDRLVGMSSFINPDKHGVVEIGGTYIAPSVRGSGFNRTMKTLMIERAFSCGYRKVAFRVDTRNERSIAAVLKLGATREGIMRKDRVTWTGYVRDTAVFGLLKEEWEAGRD